MGASDSTRMSAFTRWLTAHAGVVVALALLVSAGLAVPFLTMEPEGSASQEPAGEVFEARDLANERFTSSAYDIPFIVEAREGDLLRREPLLELLENAEALRADPEVGPKLHTYFDRRFGTDVHGPYTLADAIDDALRAQGVDGIEEATDAQVKAVGSEIIDAVGPAQLLLSGESERDARDRWTVPAFAFGRNMADDEAVGGPPAGTVLGVDDTTKEEFNREVEALLRGDEEHFQMWGVATDLNLTSAEQGQAAGPFVGFTILAVLLVVGLVYRSYWTVAISGAALALMIVWLRGLANLVGMEQDQILALIVPIAMISFGIDFVFHSFGRYKEERAGGKPPRAALVVGLAGVLGALVLALASDAAAFLSNTSAGIQSIVQFGVAAAFGLFAAFIMLGLVAPLVLMRIEERVGEPRKGWGTRIVSLLGSFLAAATAMAAVLLSVFVAPPAGIAMIAGYLVVFLLLPALVTGRWGKAPSADGAAIPPRGPSRAAQRVGAAIAGAARYRRLLVPTVLAFTAVCAYFAVQVPAQFDVKDFFDPSSRFVVSLDKLDEHGGAAGGEPALVYVEGDLAAPAAVAAMDEFRDELRTLDAPVFGRDDDDNVRVSPSVLDALSDVAADRRGTAAVVRATGVRISDSDDDGYPDRRAQVAAVYETALASDVPLDGGQSVLAADDVGAMLWQSDDGRRQAAKFEVFLAGSREQETIARAQEDIEPLIDALESELQTVTPDARAVLTGPPIERQSSLEAISRALQVSLPIAIVLCLIIAGLFMRSLRYALVTITPILLVVAWLYAFMYAFGFNMNIVTATIGAVSIGIGIDYAIHFVMRYREEMATALSRDQALRAAGESTGMALVASAASSVVGFTILAFAPMPLFASYGLLTAVMIVMALAASLLVLPSLVAMVTRDPVAPPSEPLSRETAAESPA